MTRQDAQPQPGSLGEDGAGLRRRLADVAASIATTEDQVADLLERMALALPYDAARLRAHAARARRYASQERNCADRFNVPG